MAVKRLSYQIVADETLVFALRYTERQVKFGIQHCSARNAGDFTAAIVICFVIIGDDLDPRGTVVEIEQATETDMLIAVDLAVTGRERHDVGDIAFILS